MAIQNFTNPRLKRFFKDGDPRRISPMHVRKIKTILTRLDDAARPEQMDFPGYRLRRLKGDRQGFWAVWVSKNWRIVFRFEDGDARDVDLID